LCGAKVLSAAQKPCGAGEPKISPDSEKLFSGVSFRLVDRGTTEGRPKDAPQTAKIQRNERFFDVNTGTGKSTAQTKRPAGKTEGGGNG